METIRAVDRALELLECFSPQRREIGLSELARSLALPKATVLRLARTLEGKDYLIQNKENQLYRLGPKVLALGNVFLTGFDYREVALPFMKELREKIQEAVTLYVVSGEQRLCVQRVPSPHVLRQVIEIGDRLPLERGSAGKLLVALQNLEPFVHKIGLAEINNIRGQGFAFSREEREPGLASLSAPIYDQSGYMIASLTTSGPSFRFTSAAIERYLVQLLATAREISHQLGYLQQR